MAKVSAETAKQVSNKDVRALIERFNEGYRVQHQPSGHFHVIDPEGKPVRMGNNRPITIAGTPSSNGPDYMRSLTARLVKAGVVPAADNGARPDRVGTPDEALREEQQASRLTSEEQQASVQLFLDKSAGWIKRLGGWDQRSLQTDLARIMLDIAPEAFTTIESAASTVSNAKRGNIPGTMGLAALWKLHDLMEEQEDPREYYFDRIRELRGFTPITVSGEEWPFTVELVQLTDMIVDETYQRPVHDIFTRDLVMRFDERLVGTIDLSKRRNGDYAILDGLQRFTTMSEVGKTAAWAAVYSGLTVAQEAEFFYHKNRDRKMIHPYYHFRARLVAGDAGTAEINRIVEKYGFQLYSSSSLDRQIAAIAAVERVYSFSSPFREECLTPTLDLIKRLWFGRKAATDGELIRGLGRFYQVYDDPEINFRHLEEVLAELGPQLVIGRAKDSLQNLTGGRGGSSGGFNIGRTIAEIHNTGLVRSERLDTKRLASSPSVRARALAQAPGVRE